MYKKLDDTSLTRLLEAGIDEFAEHGLDKTVMSSIANRAGMSVGVIYKYFEDKDAFFLACVDYSLELLQQTMESVILNENDLRKCLRDLVADLIRAAGEHRNYYRMYHEITSGSCGKYAAELAAKIEGISAKVYTELLTKAEAQGRVAIKGDPRLFAFFFDNLLMMLQFSFSCDYYYERMKIYCGDENASDPQAVGEAFVDFMGTALGL
ncbi:MAG: TetR/AcrR family transcriptional regulator [Lachnospiraceae bacterium]|nr:TetR/AcrR family transcriptional regulator [Lachnospiraceae bacterium]MBO4559318.1 TetR/AcrR family transcriptional regulator [Lachnospiraceae bacterium]